MTFNPARRRASLLVATASLAVATSASAATLIAPGSLVVSSTTYADVGAAAKLVAGTTVIPGFESRDAREGRRGRCFSERLQE